MAESWTWRVSAGQCGYKINFLDEQQVILCDPSSILMENIVLLSAYLILYYYKFHVGIYMLIYFVKIIDITFHCF